MITAAKILLLASFPLCFAAMGVETPERVFRVLSCAAVDSDDDEQRVCLAGWDDTRPGAWYQGAPCMRMSQQWNPFCWKEPEDNCLELDSDHLWYQDGQCNEQGVGACMFQISMWVDTDDPCAGRGGLNCSNPPCCSSGYTVNGTTLAMGTYTYVYMYFAVACGTAGQVMITMTISCNDSGGYVYTPSRMVECGKCDDI